MQCGLGAKKPDVIINWWSTTVESEKSALALCSFQAYWPSAPYPILLCAMSLDRQIIAEYNLKLPFNYKHFTKSGLKWILMRNRGRGVRKLLSVLLYKTVRKNSTKWITKYKLKRMRVGIIRSMDIIKFLNPRSI